MRDADQADVRVSIHAPARGATVIPDLIPDQISFQSTPLHEGRRILRFLLELESCFNPRPCTRGDSFCFCNCFFLSLFQSTPLHEGRLVR